MDKLWFEGSNEIYCSIQQVKKAFENLGMHYVELIAEFDEEYKTGRMVNAKSHIVDALSVDLQSQRCIPK